MWNLGNFNFWPGMGQLANIWKNWGNFGGMWGGAWQQPIAPEIPATPNINQGGCSQRDLLHKIIEQALTEMPTYDFYSLQLSSAMANHKADCIAYSLYVKIACDMLGIPCEMIFGTTNLNALFDSYHVWNKVTLDGVDYWTDVTYKLWAGDAYEAAREAQDGQIGMAAYYVINVTDGSARELDRLDLALPYKANSAYCMAASVIVGTTENQEYRKCQNIVADSLRSAGIL